MAFTKAERTKLYLRCALFGPSGSGKTMTALRMAKGIADKVGCPVAVIDTEARSASKYADRFAFEVDNLEKKTIDNYLASMEAAKKAGYKVLVIDSLSHAWRELTEEVDRITQASSSKNSILSWGKVGPKQKRLVEAILNYPGHIIATMRSKTEWVIGQGTDGKIAPEKLGLAPEQGKGIEYEFDLLLELKQNHFAAITKDRTGKFQDEMIEKPGEDFGVALYDWLDEGTASPVVSMIPAAQNTAVSKTAPAKANTALTPQVTDFKAAGEIVIQEIAGVINTLAPDKQPYFTEAEKAEARQLVSGVRMDDSGIQELREFKELLSSLLTERMQPQAARKAA